MLAIIDVLRISLHTLFSMLRNSARLAPRSWLSEFTFRLAKTMLYESTKHPISWLRARQVLLKLYGADLLKVSVEDKEINHVPCVCVHPKALKQAPQRIIVYCHGGGYTVGSADGYTLTMAKIALAAQARVIGVEYRLAPEHAIPAAQEDCLRVAEAVIEQHPESELILMGDSAGGALCLATINALANADLHAHIKSCVLLSPWLEPLDASVLTIDNEASDILDRDVTAHWKQNFYLNEGQEAYLTQSDIDVSILPPMYIQAAGGEVFLAQINAFSERLKAANCDVEYEVFEGQFHVFQTLAPLVREADNAIVKIGAFVRKC